ncbi:MAG TPA: hypothetical protein VFN35_19995 [Ktedonobacteraceae bacterium]|nr:hypothetical protein [Ktedonobacteraceae bacterium]
MSMRRRMKEYPARYPHWRRKASPAKLAKIRDKWQCVACGVEDRTLVLDEHGKPHHIIYLHAAHLSFLDPQFALTEPREGERLRAMCPACHGAYDATWKPREEEAEHEARLPQILLSHWLPDAWLQKRFLEVV